MSEHAPIKDDQIFQAFKAGAELVGYGGGYDDDDDDAELWSMYNEWLNEADDDR